MVDHEGAAGNQVDNNKPDRHGISGWPGGALPTRRGSCRSGHPRVATQEGPFRGSCRSGPAGGIGCGSGGCRWIAQMRIVEEEADEDDGFSSWDFEARNKAKSGLRKSTQDRRDADKEGLPRSPAGHFS